MPKMRATFAFYLTCFAAWLGTHALGIQSAPRPELCGGVPVPTDPFTVNHDCPNAQELLPGNYTDLWLRHDQPDFYCFDIPPLQQMRVRYTVTSGAIVIVSSGAGCTGSGTLRQNHFVIRNESSTAVLQQALYVRAEQAGGCAIYEMELIVEPDLCLQDDAFEDNDTCQEAYRLAPGYYPDLIGKNQDPDFYSVLVPPGNRMRVQSEGAYRTMFISGPYMDCVGGSFNPMDLVYINFSTSETEEIVFRTTSSGESPHVPVCQRYDLTIEVAPSPCAQDGEDVYDELIKANYGLGAFGDGLYTNLFLGEGPPTGFDELRACAPAGGTLMVNLWSEDPTAELQVTLRCTVNQQVSCLNTPVVEGTGSVLQLAWYNPLSTPMMVSMDIRRPYNAPKCGRYSLQVSGTGGCEESGSSVAYCQPAEPNSTGSPCNLEVSLYDNFNSLSMQCSAGPPGQYAMFLLGERALDPGVMLSNGRFCMDFFAGNVGRFNGSEIPVGAPQPSQNSLGRFDAFGRLRSLSNSGFAQFGFWAPREAPWGGMLASGSTYYFQAWYRDTGGGSNLSNAAAVTFW